MGPSEMVDVEGSKGSDVVAMVVTAVVVGRRLRYASWL